MGATGGTKVLLLVLLVGWEKALGLNWNPVPRKTVRYQGESAVKHPLSDELDQLNLHNCSIGWFYRSSLVFHTTFTQCSSYPPILQHIQ